MEEIVEPQTATTEPVAVVENKKERVRANQGQEDEEQETPVEHQSEKQTTLDEVFKKKKYIQDIVKDILKNSAKLDILQIKNKSIGNGGCIEIMNAR